MAIRLASRILAALGLALLSVGGLLYAARETGAGASLWTIGAGAALLLVVAALNAPALAFFLRGRAARRGADALLAILFFTAILAVVQATSARRSHQWDLTRNRRNTLAPQSTALLDSLDRDVTATGFYRQNSTTRVAGDQLLALYAHRSPRFRYHMVDPDRHPELAERLGAGPDDIVVEAGDARRVTHLTSEEAVTNAILQVTRVGAKTVYFVTGHGERDIELASREGYSAAHKGLESQGYVVRPLSLVGIGSVPDDASVLVVAGPRSDYLEGEAALLRAYLVSGGSVLFMLEPRVELPRIAALLAEYRLEVLDAVILDEIVLDAGDRTFDATVAKVRRYERHAITRGFNYVTMYPRARPVHIIADSSDTSLDARYLCITDDVAWGEVDEASFQTGRASRDGNDIAGPLPLAAVVERARARDRTRRVVLVGDSDFANNAFYGVLGNADFFQNVIAYLAADENMITIRPRPALGDRVFITESQGRFVFAVCLVALPLASIATGIGVLLRRRRL